MYLTAAHPTDGTTFWIRHTVRKPPGAEPVGSLWFTWFRPSGPRAAKVNDVPRTSESVQVSIGDLAHLTLDGATGRIAVPGLEARWELAFSGDEAEGWAGRRQCARGPEFDPAIQMQPFPDR